MKPSATPSAQPSAQPSAKPTVTLTAFINEIHFQQDGLDFNEFIEIAYPTATVDIKTYSIVQYNGFGNVRNGGVLSLSGATIGGTAGPYTFAYQDYAGVLEESDEAIALVDGNNNVVQFLDYDASFRIVGQNGAAAGLTSQRIPVTEPSSTAATESLQLTGSGCYYDDFTWTGPTTNTKGGTNTGQTFTC